MPQFNASNGLGIKKLYDARKRFKETAWPLSDFARPIDLIYENSSYGFRNLNNETIYPVLDGHSRPGMRNINGTEVEALLPVADAFSDLREFYLNFVDTVPGASSPKQLGRLQPVRGFEAHGKGYESYLQSMREFFIGKLIPSHKVYDFSGFVACMEDYITNYAAEFPLTRSGFLDSNNCSIHSTGIALDMSDLDASSDSPKLPLINNKTYRCYVDFAADHGFYVDKNVPWRLVANLDSPQMRKYITRYGPSSMTNSQILDTRFYVKSHHDDYHDIQEFFLSTYNKFALENTFESVYNKRERKFVERSPITWFDPISHGSEFWLDYLFRLRLAETGTQMSKKQFSLEKNEIIQSIRVYDVNFAAGKIGITISTNRPSRKIADSFRETKLKDFYGHIPSSQ